ncbi:MAG: hypothetical protein WD960_00800 [Gemmatimonadota bacterium]
MGRGEEGKILTSDEVEELGIDAARSLALQSLTERPVIEGTLTVRVRSFVRRGRGDWEELTDGLQEITVSLDRPEPVEVARRSLPEGRYNAVRTIFGRVEAEVVRGLTVGGEPITGTIQVDLGPEGTLTLLSQGGPGGPGAGDRPPGAGNAEWHLAPAGGRRPARGPRRLPTGLPGASGPTPLRAPKRQNRPPRHRWSSSPPGGDL